MFNRVLVANRGEVAVRVIRALHESDVEAVAVYSTADEDSLHVRLADRAVCIGPPQASESYLRIPSLVAAATTTGCEAVHPGWGFLAENPAFVEACADNDLVFIGPSAATMARMGDKVQAKAEMRAADVPVVPGTEEATTIDGAKAAAEDVGYPVLLKATAGGGGKGMRLVTGPEELEDAYGMAALEAESAFGDGRLYLEKAVAPARHVEIQVLADGQGDVLTLGERECSIQRRHQKLIEESPSPAVDAKLRAKLGEAAVAVARAAGYVGAGTIEFLIDEAGAFWFIEANARLQVEHPVTELLTGLDLVEWQLRVAAGEPLPRAQKDIRFDGHAIEARLCAEDPARNFLPQAGRLALWQPAAGVRVDHALESGIEILPHYDSLAAKLIAHGRTRDEAREKLAAALDATLALGIPTNKAFLAAVLRDPVFAGPGATTALLEERFGSWQPPHPDESVARALYAAACAEAGRVGAAGYSEWAGWSNMARPTPPAAPFALEGAVLHFQLGGHSYIWRDTTMDPPERAAAGLADGRLAAPMNGRVVAVHAKPGERIEAGRALVVLEAMKMEHTLAAPAAVRVKAVHVAKGAQVAPGKLLMEFEPA